MGPIAEPVWLVGGGSRIGGLGDSGGAATQLVAGVFNGVLWQLLLISQVVESRISPGQLVQLQVSLQCGHLAALWTVISEKTNIK